MRIHPFGPLALPTSFVFSTIYEHMLVSAFGSGCTHYGRLGEMPVEECEYLAPAVERLLRPVGDTRSVEECVAGTVIAMELVGLAELAQHRLGAVHLVAVRILVIVSEQAKQRAAQLFAQVDRRHRTLGVELALIVDDHVTAPAIDRGVDIRKGAGGEIGMPPARAKADHADLAVRLGL